MRRRIKHDVSKCNRRRSAKASPEWGDGRRERVQSSGSPKSVPRVLAHRAWELHDAGVAVHVKLLSGASTGAACDDELAAAEAVSWRAPYMTSAPMHQLANAGKIEFVDMHLSHLAPVVMKDLLGPIDFVIVESTEITPHGRHPRVYFHYGAMLPEPDLRISESNQVCRLSNAAGSLVGNDKSLRRIEYDNPENYERGSR